MSSMWRAAVIVAVLLATAPPSSAQYAVPGRSSAAPATSQSIASSLESWRALRQSSNYRFSDYAPFLIANPDWPDAKQMRAWAEKAMQPGENAGTVLAFFAAEKPRTGNGWARLAEAYASTGQSAQSLDAARRAWSQPTSAVRTSRRSGPASGRASPEPTPMRGSMLSSSPRGLTTRPVSWRW